MMHLTFIDYTLLQYEAVVSLIFIAIAHFLLFNYLLLVHIALCVNNSTQLLFQDMIDDEQTMPNKKTKTKKLYKKWFAMTTTPSPLF